MTPRARNIVRLLCALVAVQALAALVYWGVSRERSASPSVAAFELQAEARSFAPELQLVTHEGRRQRLSELRGRVVVLHFWATWCAPCVRELPELLALADDLDHQGVVVLALSLDDSWANVETFFGGRVPRQVVRAASADETRRYAIGPMPETWLIHPSGELAFRAKGARAWRSAAAREAVLALR